ncbi:mus-41 [Symbiodinium natans]|uniref:Mus-41 protein n=1 Tax=Symbiodinium natans TaxID=878477 RepID=A0A812MYK9_9DINO|nr:mus-41 [Symbiodinium natans]
MDMPVTLRAQVKSSPGKANARGSKRKVDIMEALPDPLQGSHDASLLNAFLSEKACLDTESGVSGTWYSQTRSACTSNASLSGLSALKEALKAEGHEVVLPDRKQLSGLLEWQAVRIPAEVLALSPEDLKWRCQPLVKWLFQVREPSDALPEAKLSTRLLIYPDAVFGCFVGLGRRQPGVSQPESVFECRAVSAGASANRTRRRAVNSFKLELQNNRLDPAAEQPPSFRRHALRQEQLRSLYWMQQRECETELFDLTLHRVRVDPLTPEEPLPASSVHVKSSAQLGWQLEFRQRQSLILRGGILGDAPGYGKTATTIGLIDAGTRDCQLHLPAESEPYFFKSSATLVLAPSNLLNQWLDEIQKFTGGSGVDASSGCNLKVLAIGTAAQLKTLTVDKISCADVVVCSYRLLYSPVYRRRLQELSGDFSQVSNGEATRMTVDIQSLRRNTKRFRENPDELGWLQAPDPAVGSPERTNRSTGGPSRDPNGLCFPVLEQVWWRRVVFDEFHELEAIGDTAQFDSLQCICAGCRWGLTGTPPTRDLSQVATLAKLFQLPGLPCGDGCDFEVQLAQEMAQSFLDRFARQNTSEEIEPVPLKEHLVAVEQTPEERAIYMQASHDLCEASGGPLEITGESRGIEKLIKLCSHFAAYSSMASGPSADAGTECRRILSSKEQQAKRAANQMLRCCMRLDMRLREASVASSNSSNSSIWQRRFEVHSDILRRLGAKIESPAAAGTEGELPESPATLQDDRGTLAVVAGVSQPSAAAAAAAALVEVARMCLAELQKKAGEFEETAEALKDRTVAAAEAASSSQRSLQFFQRTLAAARGDASSEQRSCSICLEEDLQEEDLSITTCAHVFHTACLHDAMKIFGNCPECRQKLGKSDVTRLAAELEAPNPGRGPKSRGSSKETKEIDQKAGSKLAVIAAHLKRVHASGEKALVFCQWEDLKRCVSAALDASGVPHLELVGNVHKRAEVLRRFQDPEDGHSLVLSLEHAASGTNLTAASHVVFVHPMYATSAERAVAYEAQAIARCRRYGQQKSEAKEKEQRNTDDCVEVRLGKQAAETINRALHQQLSILEPLKGELLALRDKRPWEFPSRESPVALRPDAQAASPETFQAAESFQGARPGYVFKVDKHGLGYYLDPVQVNRSIWDDVISKLPETWRETPHREEQLRVSEKQSCGLSMSHSEFGFVVDKVEDEPGQKLQKGEAIVAIEGRLLAGLSAPQMQASFQKRRVDGARLYVVDLAKAEELSKRDPNIIEMYDPIKQHNYFFHKKTGKSAWTLEDVRAGVRDDRRHLGL